MTVASARLIRARDSAVHGLGPDELSRRARSGALVRLRRGSYVETSTWVALSPRARQELMFQVAAEAYGMRLPLWGRSSALLHGLPLKNTPGQDWNDPTHLLGSAASGGRSKNGIVHHRPDGRVRQIVGINGLPCSDVVNTAIDLAVDQEFAWAVAAMDRLLNPRVLSGMAGTGSWDVSESAQTGPVPSARPSQGWALPEETSEPITTTEAPAQPRDRDAAYRLIAQIGNATRRRKLQAVLDFADPGGYLPGESLSRVTMHRYGFPQPELQARFSDRAGLIGYTDFHWRSLGVVGEFDGREKYVKPEYLKGRSPSEVVVAEKLREDRLRRLGLTVVRWVWADLEHPVRLEGLLRQAGLPQTARAEWNLPRT